MSSAAARATRRAVLEKTETTAAQTRLALEVMAQVGLEWRAFCHLGFWGRLRWLVTGRMWPSTPNEAEALAKRERGRQRAADGRRDRE